MSSVRFEFVVELRHYHQASQTPSTIYSENPSVPPDDFVFVFVNHAHNGPQRMGPAELGPWKMLVWQIRPLECWAPKVTNKVIQGLRAESTRAVSGRRCPCPHSGVGEDFLARQPVLFTKRAVSWKQKVEKSIQRCQIDRLAKVYKWAIDKIRGPIAKNGFLGQYPNFWAQK